MEVRLYNSQIVMPKGMFWMDVWRAKINSKQSCLRASVQPVKAMITSCLQIIQVKLIHLFIIIIIIHLYSTFSTRFKGAV